jgi:alkylation response protein AidB-like acyl-CoA dehydrogenase
VAVGAAASGSAAERLLSAVKKLAPDVTRRAEEIEHARRLPRDLVETLRNIGVFRMLVPERYGGSAIDVPSSIDILVELAAADGATGWTAMIGCHAPLMFSLFPQQTFSAIYASGPDVIAAGSSAPRGVAEPVEGGYRASGRWTFASGCEHADWIFGVCAVRDRAGGAAGTHASAGVPPSPPAGMPPSSSQAAMPALRFIVASASQWQVVDTWHSAGLRGSGSHDITLAETYLPDHRTVSFAAPAAWDVREPNLYMTHHQMYLHLCAVAVGIAHGALADLVALAQTGKRRLYARQELADTPLFQHRLGHAEIEVAAAATLMRDLAQRLWQQTINRNIDASFAARIPQASAWIVEVCARAVDACFRAAGASAVYESSPLQRRLRDIHTLTQHTLVQEAAFAMAGAKRLGRA